MTDLSTLANNLKHGAASKTDALIGGGVFSPAEQLALAHSIERRQLMLAQALAHIEDIEDPVWRPQDLIDRIEKELA